MNLSSWADRLLGLLGRETSGRRLIPEIDGVRFVAIAAVVYLHLWESFERSADTVPDGFAFVERVLEQGFLGVQLFFVISGFILGLPFARQHLARGRRISLRQYFARRVLRLEPPYLINLLLMTGVLVAIDGRRLAEVLPNLFASMTYTHNVVFGGMSEINFVAWSLEIEVQFYILAPLLALVFLIRPPNLRRTVLLLAVLASSLGSELLYPLASLPVRTIASYLHYFLAGFLLVDVFLEDWQERPRRGVAFDLVGFLAVAGLFTSGVLVPGLGQIPTPWLALAVVIGAFRGRVLNRFYTHPWIYTIGGMCYTIYLYHAHIIGATGHRRLWVGDGLWPNLLITFTVVPLIVVVVSATLFALFEKPFMRRHWHREWWRRLRRAAVANPARAR
ncbi:MAG: acyltransferase [Candidatus Krumholzibacteriia bacterium]